MKKLLSMVLVLVLVFGTFAAFSDKPADESVEETPAVTSQTDAAEDSKADAPAGDDELSGKITVSAWDVALTDPYLLEIAANFASVIFSGLRALFAIAAAFFK